MQHPSSWWIPSRYSKPDQAQTHLQVQIHTSWGAAVHTLAFCNKFCAKLEEDQKVEEIYHMHAAVWNISDYAAAHAA